MKTLEERVFESIVIIVCLTIVAALVLLFAQGCGVRKPYGAPCPPAPARSVLACLEYDGVVCTKAALRAEKTGATWSCPSSLDTWVDEAAMQRGEKDFVYCVPKTREETEGIDHAPYIPQPYRSERLERS